MRSGDTRRNFLRISAAAVGAIGAQGLSSPALAAPHRGGTLRMGVAGGGANDTMDPSLSATPVNITNCAMVYGYLVEYDRSRKIVPSVLESWEPRNGGAEWRFKVREGVEFHNGKTLDVDDVIYSINRHRGPKTTSLGAGLMSQISDLKADGKYGLVVTLAQPNAELPYVLGVNYLGVMPKDFTDFAHPIGCGPYMMKIFEPGIRASYERHKTYWKPNAAWFDKVELIVINDATARLNALLTGKVDLINRVDRRVVSRFDSMPGFSIVRSPGAWHSTFPMDATKPEFSNNDVRLALKFGIDRKQMLDAVFQGYGKLGNDQPLPSFDRYFNTDLPQRKYDADKAKFYLNRAGLTSLKLPLSTSTAPFAEAVDAASLFSQSAHKAGIEIDVVREPADGYFANVWRKKPFVMSYFSGRPTADMMLSQSWLSGSPANDSNWSNPKFDKLLLQARGELDESRRKQMYWEMQQIASDEGAVIIPIFADSIDARRNGLQGFEPDLNYEMDNMRVAERAWFSA